MNSRLAEDLDGTFEELVREHQDRLYSLALRFTGSPSDAEELAQDAFVRAYRALRGYEAARIRELNVRGWLTTIVLNLSRNHRSRPAAPVVTLDPLFEFRATGSDSPEATLERHEAARQWADLVAALPPRYRAAVLLRHLDGVSYPEMATLLGRPEGTVKAQVHRGIELLRAAYHAAERAHPARPTASTAATSAFSPVDAGRTLSHPTPPDRRPSLVGTPPARETVS